MPRKRKFAAAGAAEYGGRAHDARCETDQERDEARARRKPAAPAARHRVGAGRCRDRGGCGSLQDGNRRRGSLCGAGADHVGVEARPTHRAVCQLRHVCSARRRVFGAVLADDGGRCQGRAPSRADGQARALDGSRSLSAGCGGWSDCCPRDRLGRSDRDRLGDGRCGPCGRNGRSGKRLDHDGRGGRVLDRCGNRLHDRRGGLRDRLTTGATVWVTGAATACMTGAAVWVTGAATAFMTGAAVCVTVLTTGAVVWGRAPRLPSRPARRSA